MNRKKSLHGTALAFAIGAAVSGGSVYTSAMSAPVSMAHATAGDDRGRSASRTSVAIANAVAKKPPVANFSYAIKGYTATFTDTSTDSDGTIVAHAWTFGDGTTSSAAHPVHTFTEGNFNVMEVVTDNGGATGSKTQTLYFSTDDPLPLLANTGFESSGAWTASTGVICKTSITTCGGESPHAGIGFAWMGGYGTVHTDTLSQTTLSSILQGKVALQFYLHIDTAETSTTAAYDKLTVGIYSKTGVLLKNVATYSNLNAAPGYAMHSIDMSPWIGQQVTLKFTAVEDASLQTSFVLDDVTMIDY